MTIDEIVKETLGRWADEARVPGGLADRALARRRRGRVRTFAVIAGATAAVVAAAVVVAPAVLPRRGDDTRIALAGNSLIVDGPAVALPQSGELSADSDAAPPTKLVATPEAAMYAYYVWDYEQLPDKRQRYRQTWYLYNPATATYEKTPWAVVDVADGGYVAVLEEQHARRVGVLGPDRQVKWVDLPHPASSVKWSPDGGKLLLTSYSANPHGQLEMSGTVVVHRSPATRTGFSVVDVKSGQVSFRPLTSVDGDLGANLWLYWSQDGSLIWETQSTPPSTKRFYDLEGRPRPAPPHVAETYQEAGLSPSGRSLMVDSPDQSAIVAVKDVASGTTTPLRPLAGHWIEQSVAWSGEDKVIVWACELEGTNNCRVSEFRNRLLLVDADGGQAVPLTGYMANSQEPGAWVPLFARR
ncbi:hypothetical protein [Rhizohabitans arisaemae]|uniref:hypothetical protein n=1 Tax=Rhizohabitans arisaemae TaxID=2720610 RepID=UPI0024B06C37|nr:hypothetical protein [Rhizohabitans arisaemae]